MIRTVGDLIKKLEKFTRDTKLVIDHDENGWYDVQKIEPTVIDDEQHVNLVTSNES